MPTIEEVANDLNGFGVRVNKAEIAIGQQAVRSDRGEKDVEELWKAVDGIRNDIKGMIWKVSGIAGGISVVSIVIVSVIELIIFSGK
jgi:hypothetical protein